MRGLTDHLSKSEEDVNLAFASEMVFSGDPSEFDYLRLRLVANWKLDN